MKNYARLTFIKSIFIFVIALLLLFSTLLAVNPQKVGQQIKKQASELTDKTKNLNNAALAGTLTIIYGDTVAGALTDNDQRSRLYPDPGTVANTGRPADVFHFTGEIGDTISIKIESDYQIPDSYLFQGETQVATIDEYDYGRLTYVLEATSYDLEVVSRLAADGITTNYSYPYTLKIVRVGGPPTPAEPISYGSKVFGALTTYDGRSQELDNISHVGSYRNSFADFYKFSGSAGDTVVIQIHNTSETFEVGRSITALDGGSYIWVQGDADLQDRLLDNVGRLFDDSEQPFYRHYTWAFIQLTSDGEYMLEVRSNGSYYFGSEGVGSYILSIDKAGLELDANQLSYGGTADGNLNSSDADPVSGNYTDTYTFAAEEGDSVLIELTSDEFDTFLYLYGPDETEDANTSEQADTNYSWISQRVDESGLYTVEVTSYNFLETGSYSLSINFVTEAEAFGETDRAGDGTGDGGGGGDSGDSVVNTGIHEPNNEWTAAYGPISSGETIYSYIEDTDDVDWFYFTIEQSGSVTVDLTSLPYDYDLLLFNEEDDESIGVSELYGTDDEQIVMENLEAGSYWVKVYTYGGASTTDSYELTVTYGEDTDPGDGTAPGGDSEPNTTYNPDANTGEQVFISGEMSWEVSLMPGIGPDGTIYVGTQNYYYDSVLVALNQDGSVQWKSADVGGSVQTAPVYSSVGGGRLYLGSNDNRLYALDSDDGSLIWSYELGGRLKTCMLAEGADGEIYVGAEDGYFYAINPDGSLKWKFAEEDEGHFSGYSPVVDDLGTVYISSSLGNLYAINPADGIKKWKFSNDGYGMPGQMAVTDDGGIYINASYGLFSLDASTGEKTLVYSLGTLISDPDFRTDPVIGEDGTVYMGADNERLYAIDPSAGTEKWSFALDDDPYSPTVGSDGTIYVTTHGSLYAVNPDGTEKWKLETETGGSTGPPVIADDGVIYMGVSRWVMAVESGTGQGLAPSAWPKVAHDNYNSGRLGEGTGASGTASSMEEMIYVKSFEGTWEAGSSWGTMWLYADGRELSGDYIHDEGKVVASLSSDGETLEGAWSESPSYEPPNDGGPITFSMNEDGNSFAGLWAYGTDVPNNSWSAVRLDYFANGQVLSPDGDFLDGVEVHITGDNVDTTMVTGEYGFYHFAWLANGQYEITYSDSRYKFVPASVQVVISDSCVMLPAVSSSLTDGGTGGEGQYIGLPLSLWETEGNVTTGAGKQDIGTYGVLALRGLYDQGSKVRVTATPNYDNLGLRFTLTYDDGLIEFQEGQLGLADQPHTYTFDLLHWQGRRIKDIELSHYSSGTTISVTDVEYLYHGETILFNTEDLNGAVLDDKNNLVHGLLTIMPHQATEDKVTLSEITSRYWQIVACRQWFSEDLPTSGLSLIVYHLDGSSSTVELELGTTIKIDTLDFGTDPTQIDKVVFSNGVTGVNFVIRQFLALEDGGNTGGPDVVGCDFNGDGNRSITDVIGLLLYQRTNPGDLKTDFNGDGRANISDAISMLLAQRNGTCPDQLAALASAAGDDYLIVEKIDQLSGDELDYLEEVIISLNLTAEEEAAFRLALYGNSAVNLPKAFSLKQNAPNPFNPSTTISFTVPEGYQGKTNLKVFDLRGKIVRVLADDIREPGGYNVFWEGTDQAGRTVSSGVYFYRLQADNYTSTRKMVLLK